MLQSPLLRSQSEKLSAPTSMPAPLSRPLSRREELESRATAMPSSAGSRRPLFIRQRDPSDQNPLLMPSSPPLPIKKKAFASAALRSLRCSSAAASQAYSPSSSAAAAVRSSADWEGEGSRRRRREKKKKDRVSAGSDVWCAPGIALGGDDSVDCVVSQREMVGSRALREPTYYGRKAGNQEQVFSSPPRALLNGALRNGALRNGALLNGALLNGTDISPSEHFRYMRGYFHQTPVELEEIMFLHRRLLLRGGDAYDRYRDWRLDVDDMTYEELLELGDKIGHVSTGLREEEIECSIRKVKQSIFDKLLSPEMDRKCSICQEEYEREDEVGKLSCGHSYHMYCIKKWLLQKNACPVCKTSVSKI